MPDTYLPDLLLQPNLIRDWTDCFGSPLHVTLPDVALHRGREWIAAALSADRGFDIEIRYAVKACKSSALLRAYASSGIGADVSSVQELVLAFACGVPMSRISITGPGKSDDLLMLAITHGIVINIDSHGEFRRLLVLSQATRTVPTVHLRLCPQIQESSRFGMTRAEISSLLWSEPRASACVSGISFHLNGYAMDDRLHAVEEVLACIGEATEAGASIRVIDVGGGYPVKYMDSASFARIISSNAIWHNRPMRDYYPYDSEPSGPDFVRELLDRMALIIAGSGVKNVIMQPGRALLDRCGFTIFSVQDVKAHNSGIRILVLDGFSFSLSETWFNSDFLPEPEILPIGDGHVRDSCRCVLVGKSCLENDVVRWTTIALDFVPRSGDLVIVPNTAGYQMDSNESTFHLVPLPRKVAVRRRADEWACQLDETQTVRT